MLSAQWLDDRALSLSTVYTVPKNSLTYRCGGSVGLAVAVYSHTNYSDMGSPTSRLTPVLDIAAGNLLPWQGAQTTWRKG